MKKNVARQNPLDRIHAAVRELALRLDDEPKHLGRSARSVLGTAGDIFTCAILDAFAGDLDPLLLLCGAELDPSPYRATYLACQRWYQTDCSRLMLFLGRHVDPKFTRRRVDLGSAGSPLDAATLLIVGTNAISPRKRGGETAEQHAARVRRAIIQANSKASVRRSRR